MKPANLNPTETSDNLGLSQQTTTTGSINPEPNTIPASTPAPDDIIALIKRDRAESLKRKQRSDSFLHRLDRTQVTKVIEWLEEEEDIGIVYHNITASAPEGLGLEVGISTLRRLRAHVTATRANHRATEILDTIIDMETTCGDQSQSERIQSAINQLLHQKAFELVRTEPGSPELFELLAAIERLSVLDLKRQKNALEREKMLRHHQRASTPPPARRHQVELKIVPSTPAIEPPHNSHQLEVVAPLPEVVL